MPSPSKTRGPFLADASAPVGPLDSIVTRSFLRCVSSKILQQTGRSRRDRIIEEMELDAVASAALRDPFSEDSRPLDSSALWPAARLLRAALGAPR